jgi:CheY-like chemotaxis protein
MGSSATLELLPEPGLGNINADWDQIGDALLTLVRTCSGSIPADGRLTIETKNVELADGSPHAGESLRPGRYVSLAIIHYGPGFDEETRTRLFEPFFASSRIGVDLASVYTLIRNSGGDIRVSNGATGGIRFTIYLPAVEEPATTTPRAAEAVGESAPVQETVLVAEDEAGIRALVRKILNKQGYKVLEASNGQEALRVAASHPEPIHLLLTDVVMPGMNGRELFEQLSATRPNLKVLFISGYTGDDLTDKGSLPQGGEFLQKPFSLAVLIEKTRITLDK